jgi:type III secretion system YscQ/HrcQ family protein
MTTAPTRPALPRQAQSACLRLRSLLPQLSGRTIALRNRVLAANAHRLGRDQVLVWQDHAAVNPVGELHCKMGHHAFDLAADNLSALEPRLLGFESFVASEACTSLVEHALAPVLDLIETLSGHPVACEAFRRIVPAPTHVTDDSPVRIGFTLLAQGSRPEVRGWVRAAPGFWRALDFSKGTTLPFTRGHHVPMDMAVRLGQCRLPFSELQLLELGDALRITPSIPRQSQELPVQLVHASGRFGCRAHLAGDQLILDTLMSTLMDTTPKTPSPALPQAQAQNPVPVQPKAQSTPPSDESFMTSVECELSFELGSLRMTLAEIGKLRVGQAMRLGVHMQEQPVHILSGGREIARGELAAVGDELVVVVTELRGLPTA